MEAARTPKILDLANILAGGGSGAILSHETTDLDINLVRFSHGSGVAEHINREVDVVLVVVQGEGTLEVDDVSYPLRPGISVVIPKGTMRSIQSAHSNVLGYLSIHRRRLPLLPQPRRR